MNTLQMGGSIEQMPVSDRYYNVLCYIQGRDEHTPDGWFYRTDASLRQVL